VITQTGRFNSSITRVWPIFNYLLHRDPTGMTWLPDLLRLGDHRNITCHHAPGELLKDPSTFTRPIPRNMRGILGEHGCAALGRLRLAFEADFAPPKAFLSWLLQNPRSLIWPESRPGVRMAYGKTTQAKREALIGGDVDVRAEALNLLAIHGTEPSPRAWWAFEGWTNVDCWLETDRLILFIEGKRTEQISAATAWFPARNQIVRNIEVAAQYAEARAKEFAVMLCAESHLAMDDRSFNSSLPHLSASEQQKLRSRFLGCVTWSQVRDALCPEFTLPNTVDEAVAVCATCR
jgi:hypothetical protein